MPNQPHLRTSAQALAVHRWRPHLALLATCMLTACGTLLAPTAAQRQPGPARQVKVPTEVPPGIVSVTYTDPTRFSEARENPRESAKARHLWLDELSLHLSERAAAVLATGQRLEVQLTDVRRAGGYEPWRGPQAGDVRILRDIYPPRVDLDFKLLATDGSVLRQGKRQLRDLDFMSRSSRNTSDPLRYEKTLVDDWVAREFKPGT